MKLVPGTIYEGVAEQILPFGVVMKFEDNSTHLVHISNIADKYIKNIEDEVKIGMAYDMIAIVGKTKPVELSMKESDFAAVD